MLAWNFCIQILALDSTHKPKSGLATAMPSIIVLAGLLAAAIYIVYGAFTYGHRRKDMPTGKSAVFSLHGIVD